MGTPQNIMRLRRRSDYDDHSTITGKYDIDSIAVDLAEAFSDYPLSEWLFEHCEHVDLARLAVSRFLLSEALQKSESIFRPSTGGAVAIWAYRESSQTELSTVKSGCPTELRYLAGQTCFRRLLKLKKALTCNHPNAQAHVYFSILGVRPDLRHRGIGSKLIKRGLSIIDKTLRVPVFLETCSEVNIHYYSLFGFHVTGTYYVTPDSPITWTMWREAR